MLRWDSRVCLSASALQEQQAHPHHHPQPARAHHRRRRRLHRLHPLDAVCGRTGPPTLQPIRRDQSMAPQGEPVAECPLPLLRSPCCPAAGLRCDWWLKDAVKSHKQMNQSEQRLCFFLLISRRLTLSRRAAGQGAGIGPERFGIAVVPSTLPSSLFFCLRQTLTLPSPRTTLKQRTHLSVWKKKKQRKKSTSIIQPPSASAGLYAAAAQHSQTASALLSPFTPPRRKIIVIFCSCYHSCGLSVCFLSCTVIYFFLTFDPSTSFFFNDEHDSLLSSY